MVPSKANEVTKYVTTNRIENKYPSSINFAQLLNVGSDFVFEPHAQINKNTVETIGTIIRKPIPIKWNTLFPFPVSPLSII